MTYQDIVNWGTKNLPIEYKKNSFSDWFNRLASEFLNSGHFLPEQEILPIAKEQWLKDHETLEPKRDVGIDIIPPPEPKTIGGQLSDRFDRLPSDIEFTPKQIAQWTGFNKNTVRRELQEFVNEGTLQRVSKGRYRLT